MDHDTLLALPTLLVALLAAPLGCTLSLEAGAALAWLAAAEVLEAAEVLDGAAATALIAAVPVAFAGALVGAGTELARAVAAADAEALLVAGWSPSEVASALA